MIEEDEKRYQSITGSVIYIGRVFTTLFSSLLEDDEGCVQAFKSPYGSGEEPTSLLDWARTRLHYIQTRRVKTHK